MTDAQAHAFDMNTFGAPLQRLSDGTYGVVVSLIGIGPHGVGIHAFVKITDPNTGQVYISRGGPSPAYELGKIANAIGFGSDAGAVAGSASSSAPSAGAGTVGGATFADLAYDDLTGTNNPIHSEVTTEANSIDTRNITQYGYVPNTLATNSTSLTLNQALAELKTSSALRSTKRRFPMKFSMKIRTAMPSRYIKFSLEAARPAATWPTGRISCRCSITDICDAQLAIRTFLLGLFLLTSLPESLLQKKIILATVTPSITITQFRWEILRLKANRRFSKDTGCSCTSPCPRRSWLTF